MTLQYQFTQSKNNQKMIPFYPSYNFFTQYLNPNPFNFIHMIAEQDYNQCYNYTFEVKQQENQNQVINSEIPTEKTDQIQLQIDQLKHQGYETTKRLWSQAQDKLLINSVQKLHLNWKQISKLLPGRNLKMCYNRYKRLCKRKKLLWTKEEDEKLKYFVEQRKMKWKNLEQHFENRKAKQLRERYLNFLRSNISREPWTIQQDLKLIQCVNKLGKKWKKIQQILTNRSENQIKNRYYGRIRLLLSRKEKTKQQY